MSKKGLGMTEKGKIKLIDTSSSKLYFLDAHAQLPDLALVLGYVV